ncbi:PqqD family protein [Corallococcus sp. H22C18031201]|uniref:PqqD family protein n=1 Tax=Citreicoccus inhibens TaxID=2849499 RepID=UPI000E70B000|nr:PqqD family protein [Citreicoccus inhibens]MBU8896140.1 PqqD family protein [Citreicoccus inhibens]RJS26000.1 PqqD family protein [Corallococcus sp. H22C18031201]
MDDWLSAVPRLHPDAVSVRSRGVLSVLGPGETFLHTFEDDAGASEVAERILELADGERSVEDISRQLCEEFDVDPALCRQDTARFVALLVERQVLVLAARGTGSPLRRKE